MEAIVTVVVLTLIGGLIFELHERRAERLERLNRESWEVLRASRRIHDETAEALQAMFEEARQQARVTGAREIEK
jgi:hypothetical protein